MNRLFVDKIKLYEACNIPFFASRYYGITTKLDNKIINNEEIPEPPLNTIKRKEFVIASLTSYPKRIPFVHIAIKSLMLQTYKPDRIILWLAEEQFPNRTLPKQLNDLLGYGLEIKWMHDLYGHKKYFYPVKEQKPNEIVITYDDDIIYAPNNIERLMKVHNEHPDCLVCERGQTLNLKEKLNPGRWNTISNVGVKRPTFSMNPSPGGGCLIPYGAFHPDAIDENKIRKLAYKNDDLWYMFMCAANGTKMIKTCKFHKVFSVIDGSQMEQMATENVVCKKNVSIMENLCEAYPEAWRRIIYDK